MNTPKVVGCLVCGFRSENVIEIENFQEEGCPDCNNQITNLKKMETKAKAQAKALSATLELIDAKGFGDSDLRSLIGEISRWQEHMTPFIFTNGNN